VGALELTGVPFTGCRFPAITLCHRKHVANTLLEKAGVPVPPFALARKNELPPGLRLPVIVKPAGEDASVGIDAGSVCETKKAVKERLALVSEQWDEEACGVRGRPRVPSDSWETRASMEFHSRPWPRYGGSFHAPQVGREGHSIAALCRSPRRTAPRRKVSPPWRR
jgi:hypothetical protein